MRPLALLPVNCQAAAPALWCCWHAPHAFAATHTQRNHANTNNVDSYTRAATYCGQHPMPILRAVVHRIPIMWAVMHILWVVGHPIPILWVTMHRNPSCATYYRSKKSKSREPTADSIHEVFPK